MPKMKSHRGAAKRFRRTGTGKLVHQKKGRRHFLSNKSTKRKRQLRGMGELTGGDKKKIDQLIPYS